ncbi:hypothetical protein SLE2022_058430 [Rubroshorea leprosula]
MARSLGAYSPPLICKATAASYRHVHDVAYIRRAVDIADKSAGFTSPHPNFGCVIATQAEMSPVRGTCTPRPRSPLRSKRWRPEASIVEAPLPTSIWNPVTAMAITLRSPLLFRQASKELLLESGILCSILEAILYEAQEAQKSCLLVNLPLIHIAISRVPFSVLILKYAITLDGKIAASSGYAAWISSKLYRNRVFELRGRSNASIVGGNTVCRDNPRLTARRGGYSDYGFSCMAFRSLAKKEDIQLSYQLISANNY